MPLLWSGSLWRQQVRFYRNLRHCFFCWFFYRQCVSTAGFTVQYGSNPETLDPALNSAVDGGNTIITVFETLLIINENNEAVPGSG